MIKINSTDLAQALGFLYQAYANKTPMPIMQNVKLESSNGWLHMVQTNNEQELTFKIPCDGDDETFTVEMKKFKERVSQYPKGKDVTITLDEDGKKSVVKCGRSKITLNSLPSDEFPSTQTPSDYEDITVDGGSFKRGLSVVKNAQAQNDVRHYLNGVYLGFSGNVCDIVATDGHRLHHYEFELSNDVSERVCIVPRDSIAPIYKYLDSGDITIRVSANSLRISDEESSIQTQLIDGKYPDWKRILPKANPIRVTFNKEELDQALKGALVASNEKYKGVRLSVGDGLAKFESSAPDGSSSEEVIECAIGGGDELELGLNGAYILDAIAAVESENVDVLFKDSNSAALMKDGKYQAVVMPMRL